MNVKHAKLEGDKKKDDEDKDEPEKVPRRLTGPPEVEVKKLKKRAATVPGQPGKHEDKDREKRCSIS